MNLDLPEQHHLLVTGASGFLGRAVVAQAQAQGLHVTALRRTDADLCDPAALAAVVDKLAPDMVIDAAGVVPGPGNRDPMENVRMTKGWLEALDRVSAPLRLVLAGSAAVYGEGAAPDRPTRETDPMRPTSRYGHAKLAALELAVTATAQRGHDVQTGIVFNLIGARQPPHMVPRVFIEQALNARNGLFESGHSGDIRDFLQVTDAANALIAMARFGAKGDVLNVATGRPTRISEILDIVTGMLGVRWVSRPDPAGSRADHVCYGDPTRLHERTGWTPEVDLETALGCAVKAFATARRQA